MNGLGLDVDLDFGAEPSGDQQPQDYRDMQLELLWMHHETLREAINRDRDEIGRMEQELTRRALALRPDFAPESGGGVDIAGESLVLAMTYDRTYEYDEAVLLRLGAMEEITASEYGRLVKYEPKVNGTVFNQLVKRGGKLADVLNGMRTLRRAAPKFAARERVA